MTSTQTEIQTVFFTENGKLKIQYQDLFFNKDGKQIRRQRTEESNELPHQDLYDARECLLPHATFSNGILNLQLLYSMSSIEGVIIDENDKGIGITFLLKQTNEDREVKSTGYPIYLKSDNYPFMEDFEQRFETFEREVKLFLRGKSAANPQLDLFDENNVEVEERRIELPPIKGHLNFKGINIKG